MFLVDCQQYSAFSQRMRVVLIIMINYSLAQSLDSLSTRMLDFPQSFDSNVHV